MTTQPAPLPLQGRQGRPRTTKATHNRKRTEPLRKAGKLLQAQLNAFQRAVVEARKNGTPHPVLSDFISN